MEQEAEQHADALCLASSKGRLQDKDSLMAWDSLLDFQGSQGQEEPGGARRGQEGPEGARRSQGKPGGARVALPTAAR